MWKRTSTSLIVVVGLCGSGIAVAGDGPADKAPATQPSKPSPAPDPAPAPAPTTDASADVKAGTGVENKALVGEASEFPAGTKVWVWSQVKGQADTSIKHVWKRDGKDVWTATLKVKSNKWATYSRRSARAGAWTVEVQAADGTVLGSVSFAVK